ncbi:MAG TPA: hypothetical protein VMZ74_05540 [Ramlibacter sp.]|nr:hypothetical protein [Ramlibacter sp.]
MADYNFTDQQKAALQRIALLQRAREEAKGSDREFESIEKLIEIELKFLRDSTNAGGDKNP